MKIFSARRWPFWATLLTSLVVIISNCGGDMRFDGSTGWNVSEGDNDLRGSYLATERMICKDADGLNTIVDVNLILNITEKLRRGKSFQIIGNYVFSRDTATTSGTIVAGTGSGSNIFSPDLLTLSNSVGPCQDVFKFIASAADDVGMTGIPAYRYHSQLPVPARNYLGHDCRGDWYVGTEMNDPTARLNFIRQ